MQFSNPKEIKDTDTVFIRFGSAFVWVYNLYKIKKTGKCIDAGSVHDYGII